MEDSPIVKGERQRKIIGQTIKRDLHLNGLSLNLIHDRTL